MAPDVFYALVLNLHQPPGNLEHLLEQAEWEAREILYAMDRIPRSVWGHEDLARVHLSLSGTLLETLSSPGFQERAYGIVKCGDLLWHLRHPSIEILGTGYYHPVLPLIPPADREEHLARWSAPWWIQHPHRRPASRGRRHRRPDPGRCAHPSPLGPGVSYP
jgi:hypothetical protein